MNSKQRQEELNKLKNMNKSDRIWYLWAYYKIPIILAIFAIIVLILLGNLLYHNLQQRMLYFVTVDETVSDPAGKQLQSDFDQFMGFDQDWRQVTVFDYSLHSGNSEQVEQDLYTSQAFDIKFTSLVNTKAMDVLVTTPLMCQYYTSQDLFLDLTEALPDTLYEELSRQERLVFYGNYSGERIASGILLDGTLLSERLSLTEGSTLSLCSLEHSRETVLAFLSYALGIEEERTSQTDV